MAVSPLFGYSRRWLPVAIVFCVVVQLCTQFLSLNNTNSEENNIQRVRAVSTTTRTSVINNEPSASSPSFASRHTQRFLQEGPSAASISEATNARVSSSIVTLTEQDPLPSLSVSFTERSFDRPANVTAPNINSMTDIARQKRCLVDYRCQRCLRVHSATKEAGSNCDRCREDCKCLCQKLLCQRTTLPTHVSKEVTIEPVTHVLKDRYIPRIVHQLVIPDGLDHNTIAAGAAARQDTKQLTFSFQLSNWEYRSYTLEQAGELLQAHFSAEIAQAFTALASALEQRDFFGYCILLLHGGVSADQSVLLGASLDVAIPADASFMVPQDSPGRDLDKGHCLWNGFIASAPGHPFLAKMIENAVNQIRNRAAILDIHQGRCAVRELSVLYSFEPRLFRTGSCALGTSVNQVLERPMDAQFEAGDLLWPVATNATTTVATPASATTPTTPWPGRTIVLLQKLHDLGAHRFSLPNGSNRIVGSTLFLPTRLLPQTLRRDDPAQADTFVDTERSNDLIRIVVAPYKQPTRIVIATAGELRAPNETASDLLQQQNASHARVDDETETSMQVEPKLAPEPVVNSKVATLEDEISFERAPNFVAITSLTEVFRQKDCSISYHCIRCLQKKEGSTCDRCSDQCKCLCKKLVCQRNFETTHVTKEVTVVPPASGQERMIPRIVHQMWSIDHAPTDTRLQASFRSSGWEYRHYSLYEASQFLQENFPAEIFEAFDLLVSEESKSDFFRYCILLIRGGVFADTNVQLGSSLDLTIASDVGFMVPFDDPGRHIDKGHCLWNGFIAAAPGHPFLAKTIETAVNQIRNRAAILDIQQSLSCPNPELSMLYSFKPRLYHTGSCLLGTSVNQVLHRPPQQQFEAGDLPWFRSTDQTEDVPIDGYPGRTIVLHQLLRDMGAHRFSLPGTRRIVGSTTTNSLVDRKLPKQGVPPRDDPEQAETYTNSERSRDNIRIKVGRRKHDAPAADVSLSSL